MSKQIDVTGIDAWELLAALHNNAKVSPTILCQMQARNEITASEARQEAQAGLRSDYMMRGGVPLWADYLFGRPIKAFLQREGDNVFLARTDLYDRDAGPGAAQRVVNALRMRGAK